MSDPPKITKDEKTEGASKIKYPRRVEAGKKLAAISREAKERKAAAVKNYHEVAYQREISDELVRFAHYIDFTYFIAGVGFVASIGGLYFAYQQDK